MKNAGFSVVELLVAVAIVGILSAVAIPQYRMFRVRTQRTEAISLLSYVFKSETAIFGATGAYYPPADCGNPTCFYSIYTTTHTTQEINDKLGLGPNILFHGWKFSRDYLPASGDHETAYAILKEPNAFQVYLTKDMDGINFPAQPDSTDKDWWFLQSCPALFFTAKRCGVPVMHYDDIRRVFGAN